MADYSAAGGRRWFKAYERRKNNPGYGANPPLAPLEPKRPELQEEPWADWDQWNPSLPHPTPTSKEE